ncbi:unnamed protein product [Strongylus vulgaris]|uniref:phospholipase A2 n=1 Tax=Strongylus vulgaris TaxID=40348 RepID=A0A3P7J4F6_STRVU|nr:unnamed protein product [Strongylus vulgaris]
MPAATPQLVVFPTNDHRSLLRVVQGSFKNKPAEPLHHVVFSLTESPNSPAYSLFRSTAVEDAMDLCRRCLECYILFRLLDRSSDAKKSIQDLMAKLKQYPLYRMIHIAIACDRQDLFSETNVEYLNNMNTPFHSLMNIMVQPEGKYPLLLAIEMHRLKIVRRMLAMGADPLAFLLKVDHFSIIKAIIEASPDLVAERDSSGNTALHVATHKTPLMGLLLLKCKDVDLNAKNNAGQTPLHIFTHRGEIGLMITLLSYACNIDAQDNDGNTALHIAVSKRNLEVCFSYSSALRTFPPVLMFYEQLIARLVDLASRHEKPTNMVNLLSLDGGGIRGLVILQTLMAIEEELNEPIFPFFDWVAGTSTGALIATALAQGKTLRECQHIYLRFKDLIFDGWTRPYNASVLEMFMKEAIGEKSLDDIKYPRLMISTVKADYFPVKLEFMRNYRLPLSNEENIELGFVDPAGMVFYYCSVSLRDISRKTSFLNFCEICLCYMLQQRPEDKVEIGCILSLGTGQIPLSPLDPLHVEIFNPISSAFTFKNLSLILVDQVTATEGAPVDRSRSWCNAIGVPFFRLSAPLHKDIGLGTKDDHDIAHMMWDCIEYTHKHHSYIVKICALLKRLGKTPLDRPRALSSPMVMGIGSET